jgi:hypothetical protein
MIVSKHICYVKAKPLTLLAHLMSDVLCMTLLALIYELALEVLDILLIQ